MKNNIKKIYVVLFAFLLLFVLGSCGRSSGVGVDSGNIVDTSLQQKIIYSVDYDLSFDDMHEKMSEIIAKSREVGGYVLNSNENLNSGTYVIKVPVLKLDEFVNYIDSLDGTSNKNVSTKDVTSSYNEIESKLEVLYARKEAYLNLLKKDNISLDEQIMINKELDEVETEIKALEYDKASLDAKIDYSTVTIRCRSAAEDNFFYEYIIYLRDFFVFLFKAILYFIPIGLIMGLLVGLIFLINYLLKKRKIKKLNNETDKDKKE